MAWSDLRWRRIRDVGIVPVVASCGRDLRQRCSNQAPFIMFALTAFLGGVGIWLGVPLPECQQQFHYKLIGARGSRTQGSPWASKCIHCGIAIGTPKDPITE